MLKISPGKVIYTEVVIRYCVGSQPCNTNWFVIVVAEIRTLLFVK